MPSRERRPLVADGVSAIQPSAAVRRVRAEFRYYRLDEHSNSNSCPQQPGIQKARSSGLEGKMSHLVHNEQMKLAANLFNNLAVVSLASGILVPIFSTRTSATPISFSEGGYAIFGGLSINTLGSIFLGLVCCVVFEVVAQSFLAKLKE
jgi:hypothetical protein